MAAVGGRIKYVLKQLIANGHDRNELLNTTSGVLTDAQLEGMSEWEVTDVIPMQKWLNRLEKYNVFFSAPLDIDFMMLEQMEAEYKNTLGATEGPRVDIVQNKIKQRTFISTIEDSGKVYPEYEDRIKKDIRNTLKEEGGEGCTYSAKQQKLMVWYTYFFLNRGKPSTHIAVLSRLDDESIKANIPPVLKRLIEALSAH